MHFVFLPYHYGSINSSLRSLRLCDLYVKNFSGCLNAEVAEAQRSQRKTQKQRRRTPMLHFANLKLAVLLGVILAVPAVAQNVSPNGKFSVGGDSVGSVAILRISLHPSLDGPLRIEVKDSAGNDVTQSAGALPLSLTLPRNRNMVKVSIDLASAGDTHITVRDSNNATEFVTIVWQAGSDLAVPPVANTFSTSTVNPSRGGKLWAEAERIADRPDWAHVKVHIDNALPGFDLVVRNASNKVVDRGSHTIPRGGGTEFSIQVRLEPGDNTIEVTVPGTAERAVINVPAMTASFTAPETDNQPLEYDWGRVRGYFASGVIFSKERDDFSKTDIFLDFTLDKTYNAKPFGPFKNFNTFFNARLTSIPVTAAESDSETPTPTPTEEPCNTADCAAFITSRKAAMMQGGIYLPMYWDFTTWKRRVPRLGRAPRTEMNALFIAPLVKGGILTTTGQETAEARQFGGDDVFNFFSLGYMIGHYRLHGVRSGGKFIPNTDVAPELISWLTLSYGRFENFEIETPTGIKDAAGNDILWRQRPWRIEALGRLKIPETPFIIGFDGNFVKGPDDLRFIFGTRFDIGKILHTIRVAAAQDDLGRTPAAAASGPSPP